MKYMIASDIHGSAWYCRKMMEALEKEQADRLILLGDLLYHCLLYTSIGRTIMDIFSVLTMVGGLAPVSYTHLDVYKRQKQN